MTCETLACVILFLTFSRSSTSLDLGMCTCNNIHQNIHAAAAAAAGSLTRLVNRDEEMFTGNVSNKTVRVLPESSQTGFCVF